MRVEVLTGNKKSEKFVLTNEGSLPTKEELTKCYEFGVELSEIANGKMIEVEVG